MGSDDPDRDRNLPSGEPLRETSYRDPLDEDVDIDVRFLRRLRIVVDYVIVLLVCEGGAWCTVRVYDNTHGDHDMHRYNQDGVKQPPEVSMRVPRARRCEARLGQFEVDTRR